jgi:RNA polymerase sigma-70 factor (ECF subfamily)
MRNPTLRSMTIDHLIRSAPADDPAFAETLLGEYYGRIRRLCRSLLNDEAEADDAAQDTFITATRALPGYRGEASVKTWLYAIAVNACRARLRQRQRRQALQQALEAIHTLFARSPGPEEAAIHSEADQQLWQAVDSLGEKHRLPVVLRYVHELSAPEIAEILDLSVGTVHSRLHYARQTLQQRLARSQSPEEVAR